VDFPVLNNVSFTARGGEILGIAGVAGSGQRELCEAITGLYPIKEGAIRYIDPEAGLKDLVGKTPMEIRKLGVSLAFVPEDRLGMGLVAGMGMTDNMMLRSYRRGHTLFADRKAPKQLAERIIEQLEVVTPGTATPVRRLSGVNVQKVLVAVKLPRLPPCWWLLIRFAGWTSTHPTPFIGF
jgi:simple sugar transport system ATP-binding protein